MIDKLFGVVLVATAVLWTLRAVVDHLGRSPTWYGVFLALGALIVGCYIVASVVRDRL